MSQDSSESEMRAEYDIRGGVRGKYFLRYLDRQTQNQDNPWVLPTPATASTGIHRSESTIRIGAKPIYVRLPFEVGEPTEL